MNKSANEFECGSSDFISYKYALHVFQNLLSSPREVYVFPTDGLALLWHIPTKLSSAQTQRAVTKNGNIHDSVKLGVGFLPAIVYIFTIFFQYNSYHSFPSRVIIWTSFWP